ncbi:diiron oxygenase [Nocardia sp. CNY236]|uniref:AurF N-oxygenase family protein n=1 Tax=Nocardia sp. CNY236 TaxID=1169152 RepID=UPI000688F622|nr:diiron oxygenase [Nocardia sp. CNY236]
MKPVVTSPSADSDTPLIEEYDETVRMLTDASVRKHFDPYTDIDWDDPDMAAEAGEERWILPPDIDVVAMHPWYQELPTEKKIAIGKYRMANLVKVGQQIEHVLVSGMTLYNFDVPNGSPEFEYCTREMLEEHYHSLMFQKMIDRIGVDVPGVDSPLRELKFLAALAASWFPNLFFMVLLAGEEPLDHIQKQTLRAGERAHPIVRTVTAIHLAEEARHISFASEFLKTHVPQKNRAHRFVLSLVMPLLMREVGYALVVPPRGFFNDFDIPRRVGKEMFGNAAAVERISDYFDDLRALAMDIGLMNPVAKMAWKILRVGGRPSRYRSEPHRVAT